MNEELVFLSEVGLAAGISLGVIAYLRGILRCMLLEICDRQPQRAEFWVRLLDMMMLIAPVILMMLFGTDQGSGFAVLRRALLLVLIGQFISLAIVGRTIWGFLQPQWRPVPPPLAASRASATGTAN